MNMQARASRRSKQVFFLAVMLATAAFPVFASAKVTFSLYPTAATLAPNGYISVGLYVSSPGAPINAVSGTLDFPAGGLQGVSIDTSDSIAGLWIDQPKISQEDGTVTFAGVIFNPGFAGSLGKVFSVRFKAAGNGPAKIALSSAHALANDGQGTDLPVAGLPVATVNVSSLSQNGTNETSAAAKAGNVLPHGIITSQPGSASAVAQALSIVLILLAFSAAIYNCFMITRIARRMPTAKKRSESEEALLKKLKKDIKEAEDHTLSE